jgi:hypothetical protein
MYWGGGVRRVRALPLDPPLELQVEIGNWIAKSISELHTSVRFKAKLGRPQVVLNTVDNW